MEFTEKIAQQLLCSRNQFPVDFDDAIEWWDCRTKSGVPTKKSDLKDKLTANFDKGSDYTIDNGIDSFAEFSAKPQGGRPREVISLTVECFKMMGMMIAGERGNQIRRYFLRCEAELKESHRQRVINAVVDDQHTPWEKRFEDEFFDQAYRITGWQRPEKGHYGCMGNFINRNVYELFPEGVPDRLREVNPSIEGRRKRKHHQHLTKNLGRELLAHQKGVTIAVMRLSPSNDPRRFKQNMRRACGESLQIEFPFMNDMDVEAS